MFFYRGILRILQATRKSKQMAAERTLMLRIRKRFLKYFGHIMKKAGEENLTPTGNFEGKRGRGI